MSEPNSRWNLNSRAAAVLGRYRWVCPAAPPLWRVLELALFARVAAAAGVQWYVERRRSPRICIFDDAEYYWALAGTICRGAPYEILEWGDIPHFALRVPGYPAFLAACRTILGDRTLGVRLVQAGLGALSVWLLYHLSSEILGTGERLTPASRTRSGQAARGLWTIPLVASVLGALHPHFVVISSLLLSEAVFLPLMLLVLWAMALIWKSAAEPMTWRLFARALGVGVLSGTAILVRPSWALFVPTMLFAWFWSLARSRGGALQPRFRSAAGIVAAISLGLVLVMSPWWIRNTRILGRFVPTAVWIGASLYDGLNSNATGASDMSFLEAPDIWPLDELDQDRELASRAWDFARSHPSRVFELAMLKLVRYWSPWPNAEGIRSPWLSLVSAIVTIPLLALAVLGLLQCRANPRAWVLLAGPILYFCIVHMIFSSSMRYRIPGELPAMGLAANGVMAIAQRRLLAGRGSSESSPRNADR
jgi:hypothetical protein